MIDTNNKPAVAFVVAHPDDVPFSMGGTAWLLKDRYDLHVLCLTKGERGYKWDGAGPAPADWEIGNTRADEERKSCEMLGAELTFLDQADGGIFPNPDICQRVADMLNDIKPVAVFTHGPIAKPDHASTCMIARQSLCIAKRFWETEIYMSESLRHANIFVNTASVIEKKKELVFFHQHHLHDPTFWDKILEEDRAAGKIATCKYAEAFVTETPIVNTRWDRKAGSILLDLCP